MKRTIHFLAYGVAGLTILFSLALPLKVLPIFVSVVRAMDLKIAPWFSGGEAAFVIDRGTYRITVNRPVYPALVGEGTKGFVQLVLSPRAALPPQVQTDLDLNRDGTTDCEISISNVSNKAADLRLTVIPKAPWVLPVQNSKTTALDKVLIEKGRDAVFVRIPVRKTSAS
jgi:hypothetical protein